MPRQEIEYDSEFPFHITARSNSQEWFRVSKKDLWKIATEELAKATIKRQFSIHAFVLMSNHYHLIGSCSPEFRLDTVMCPLQTAISKRVNLISGRSDHVFGGRYRASVINKESYFFHVLKYVYRNPIRAGIVRRADDYEFSTLTSLEIPLSYPINGISALIPENLLAWVNEHESEAHMKSMKKGLKRRLFEFV